MKDTPETYEAVERWNQGKINIFDEMARLERERDEAIQRRMETILQCELLEKERDEARDDAQKSKAYKRVLKETNARLKRERDEAREQTAKMRDISDGCLIALERATKYLPEYSRVNYEDALWRLRKKLEDETK